MISVHFQGKPFNITVMQCRVMTYFCTSWSSKSQGFAVLLSIVSALLSICFFCIFHYLFFFSTDILLSHACKNICTYLLFIGFLRQYWNGLLFIYPVNKLNHKGSPRILEWLYSSACSRPRNRTGVSCIACEFFTNWAIKEAPPVDHSLSEFSTMTHSSWVALHSTAHSFTELEKTFIHVINLISFLWLWFSFGLP